MNCSLIFRGQLNYPFQLIFSFAGCASYGSFNVSSVCVLITHRKRIYNSLLKMHIQHRVQMSDRDFILFNFCFYYTDIPRSKHHKNRQMRKKREKNGLLYLRLYLFLDFVNDQLVTACFVFILMHSWNIKSEHVNDLWSFVMFYVKKSSFPLKQSSFLDHFSSTRTCSFAITTHITMN